MNKRIAMSALVVSLGRLMTTVVLLAAAPDDAESNGPPERLCSPSGRYCLRIVPQKGHSLYEMKDATLIVSSGKKVIAKYPTFGFLMDAFGAREKGMSRSTIAARMAATIPGSSR